MSKEKWYIDYSAFKESLQARIDTFCYELERLSNRLSINGLEGYIEKFGGETITEQTHFLSQLLEFLALIRNTVEIEAIICASFAPQESPFAIMLYRASWIILEVASHITTNPACQVPLNELLGKINDIHTFLKEELSPFVEEAFLDTSEFKQVRKHLEETYGTLKRGL